MTDARIGESPAVPNQPPAQFVGTIYIGRDEIERLAPDIPTLAAYIRGGDILASTLIRTASASRGAEPKQTPPSSPPEPAMASPAQHRDRLAVAALVAAH
jgi:hypothetical protein